MGNFTARAYRLEAEIFVLPDQRVGVPPNCQALAGLLHGQGALGRIRTCDTRFRKPMLYPLSYEGGIAQE
jgi:hypothetical protein